MDGTKRDLSGERRIVTALFCDVVGSTSIAETLDPEDWSELARGAIDTMGTVVSRFGGTVTEFAGDGIVALFGAPIAHEDDPYRAVSAGLSIVEEMSRSQETRLEVRVGIHTGLVVVGDVSTGDRSSYSALGDTLNVAARLQEIAEPGSVVMSSETRRLLGAEVEAVSRGLADLKGRKESVGIYVAKAVHPAEHRRRGLPGIASPMVGRSEELARLEKLAALSRAGTGRVAAILGEPGVGKSRLVAELGAGLRGAEATVWAVGTCVAFDDEIPYHLAASLLRSLAAIAPSEAPGTASAAIEALALDAGLPELAPSLTRLLGVPGYEEPTNPDLVQRELADALVSLVSALAGANRLVVVVCEDAHWADAASVEMMMEVMARVPSLPILMLIVMRPDRGTPGWALLEQARRDLAEALAEIRIGPLEESDSRALVSNLLEVESLPPTLRRLVLDKAEGNPFFLEEVIRMLIDGELVENRDGRWIGREQIGDLDVPETIEGLVASRIDMIGPDLRRAGRVASVIGRRFTARIFDEVYDTRPDERGSLHPHLAELESHGLIRVEEIDPELEFSFRHALIHEVMYRGLLRRERRDLHGDVAEAMERVYADRLQELAPSLARHYAEAGIADKAVSYFFTAGKQAQSRGARVEAERFFARAQALLEADPEAEPADLVDAVIGRLTAGMAFTPGQEAIEIIESVMPIAEELGDPDRLAKLYERLIWTLSLQGETYANPGFRERLETGYALVARVTDPGTQALLHAMMGGALRSGDEFQEAVEPLSKAVDGLNDVGRFREASYYAAMLADSLSQVGRFEEAIAAIEHARELGELSGDPNAVLDADIIHGSIAADRGDLEEALVYTRRGIEGAETHGNTFCNLAGNFRLADQQLRLGDVETAITHLEMSTGLAQFCDAGGYEALAQAWLAQARSRTGDLRPDDFDQPLASAVESGSRSMEGLIRLQRAIALAGSGDHERARPDFERAIELFADYGGLPNSGRAHHAYGQALEAAGRPEEAEPHLREAQQIFENLGIRPDPVGTR